MWPNAQFPADLITFTEEILKGKLYFLCRVNITYKDRIYDSVLTRENKGQGKPVFWHILRIAAA